MVYANGNNNEAGRLTIDAQRISLINNGRISSDVWRGSGTAGNSSIQATESLEIRGLSAAGGSPSGILSSLQAGTTGQGGQISIEVGRLILAEGGTITSGLSGNVAFFGMSQPGANGTAGNIEIRAREVEVSDPVSDFLSGVISGITASVGNGATGSGGSINIQGDRLRVFNGGQITSSSLGQGAAGSVNLQVKDIDVQGISQSLFDGRQLPSTITAASANAFTAQSVNIIADSLRVRDQAEISVNNSGTGNAGNLNIRSRSIFLDNQASLRAEVNGGSRGNIRLLASDFLLLRNGSKIITNAASASTGGNININADFIVAVPKENSDISANAVMGSGGNIQITTQGLFGLQFREQLTPESDITASSQFGLSGTVQVNTVGIDPNSGLVELPANISDPSQQIATGCTDSQGSRFVAIGRGGIPQNPTQEVTSDVYEGLRLRTWSDIRDISAFQTIGNTTAQIPESSAHLVQATSTLRRKFS